ncbi:MAG TPA: histidine--tRNA ligase [Actinomycetota bacterium]|nr:histidine--tRNA ligase [Actinomycetota bacterium]
MSEAPSEAGAAGPRGFAPPRGTQDLLPDVADSMEVLGARAASLARRYGFRRIETPVFDHTELWVRAVGETTDIVTKEMYTFEDKGGRSLTLRPEGTSSVVRAYLANRQALPTPFKAYYIAQMFRHERPQAGRMRQHTQFGVEVIGTASPRADVEVIEVGHRYLTHLGLARFELHLNSIGDENCRPAYREALVEFLRQREDRLGRECRERMRTNPLRVLDCKEESCRAATEDAPRLLEYLDDACRRHFEEVQRGLAEAGIGFSIDHRLVRGLDYYTRTAFEFVSEVLGSTQSTLCGGGRYDGLAETLGGEPTPGIGFGLGLERALLAMEREGLDAPRPDEPLVFVVALGEDAGREGRSLVRALRAEGVPAEAALEERPLKAQLRMADRAGASYAAILGEEELQDGVATMRRMADGQQERVKLSEVPAWVRG